MTSPSTTKKGNKMNREQQAEKQWADLMASRRHNRWLRTNYICSCPDCLVIARAVRAEAILCRNEAFALPAPTSLAEDKARYETSRAAVHNLQRAQWIVRDIRDNQKDAAKYGKTITHDASLTTGRI